MHKFYSVILTTGCILLSACITHDTKVDTLQSVKGELGIFQGEYQTTPSYATNTMGLIAHTNIWEFLRGFGSHFGDTKNCTKNTSSLIKIEVTQNKTVLLISEMRGDCTYHKKEFILGKDIFLQSTGELVFALSIEEKHSIAPADVPTEQTVWLMDQSYNLNVIQTGDKNKTGAPSTKSIIGSTLAIYEKIK